MTHNRIERTARAAIEHVFPGAIAVGDMERFGSLSALSTRFEVKFNYIRAELKYKQNSYLREKWTACVWIYMDGVQQSYGIKRGSARGALRQAYAEAYTELQDTLIVIEKRLGRLQVVMDCLTPPK